LTTVENYLNAVNSDKIAIKKEALPIASALYDKIND
jgi:hypothetical protein